ncbi:hypothetical protein [Novosphingobium lentum]|nr:hypothetical protein [Novosphingobium lentum]
MRTGRHILAIGIAVLIAILVVAWIKGGTQPMRWIEQPVKPPRGAA